MGTGSKTETLAQQWRKRTAIGGALFLKNLLADDGNISPSLSPDDLRLAYMELLSGRDRAQFFANLTSVSLAIMSFALAAVLIGGGYLVQSLRVRHADSPSFALMIAALILLTLLAVALGRAFRQWRLYIGDLRLCTRVLPLLREELTKRTAAVTVVSSETPGRQTIPHMAANSDAEYGTAGGVLLLKFVVAPVAVGVALYICSRVGDAVFPRKPTVMIADKDAHHEFHLPVLRQDMPPYVYKIEWNQYAPGTSGILGIGARPPTWYFKMSLANLTTATTGLIDLRAHCRLDPSYWGIYSLSTVIFQEPKKPLSPETIVWGDNRTGLLSIGIAPLDSGKASSVFIFIQSNLKPTADDFDLTLCCSEGSFSRVTPLQWEKIGWEKADSK